MNLCMVWFRRDLRLADHAALRAAITKHERVIPFFILDEEMLSGKKTLARQMGLLLENLRVSDKSLQVLGSRLILRKGEPVSELLRLAKETGAKDVYATRENTPAGRRQEASLSEACRQEGLALHLHGGEMIHDPGEVLKADGTPYLVFTPYFKAWSRLKKEAPFPSPGRISTPLKILSDSIPTAKALGYTVDIPLPAAGESEALKALDTFSRHHLAEYERERDLPACDSTSRLSHHLAYGTISPRTIYHRVSRLQHAAKFLSEMVWRDFYKMILHHFPYVETGCFKKQYDGIPWKNDPRQFKQWCEGRTGYPIIDAAMRQLNQTGWMHNRLRMIVASFLTKDLHISWQWGERYFRQQLFDYDLASNNGGWQWSAGTGTDAQPYFRIFNPTAQAEKFDPEGKFIQSFVPEADLLTYPPPMVQHSTQRVLALEMYQKAKGQPREG